MVKIQKRIVKTNGSYQITIKVKGNTWLAGVIENNYKNERIEMVLRYIKVACKDLKMYYIAIEDMLNLRQIQQNIYQVDILKYKKLID